MSPTDLISLFDSNPGRPFRLTLSSGDTVDVDNPSRTLFEGMTVYVGQADDPEARQAKRIKVVSIPNIALAEMIEPRMLRTRRRR
jgi:hypothetical protein